MVANLRWVDFDLLFFHQHAMQLSQFCQTHTGPCRVKVTVEHQDSSQPNKGSRRPVLTCDIKRNCEGTLHGSLHRLGGERGAGEGGAVVLGRRRELQHRLGLPDGRDPFEGGRGAEVCKAVQSES